MGRCRELGNQGAFYFGRGSSRGLIFPRRHGFGCRLGFCGAGWREDFAAAVPGFGAAIRAGVAGASIGLLSAGTDVRGFLRTIMNEPLGPPGDFSRYSNPAFVASVRNQSSLQ